MTAVEDRRVGGVINPASSDRISLEDRDKEAFIKRLHALMGYLEDYGKPDAGLNNIQVLYINNIVEGERVTVSSGLDASKFFQIIPAGDEQPASEVEFLDRKEGLVTPTLCTRIEISDDRRSPFNYIVSDEGVFEVATRRPSTQESANGRTTPHVIYDTISHSYSRSTSGDWTNVAPIDVQRLSEKDEKAFITRLEGLARHKLTFAPRKLNS